MDRYHFYEVNSEIILWLFVSKRLYRCPVGGIAGSNPANGVTPGFMTLQEGVSQAG